MSDRAAAAARRAGRAVATLALLAALAAAMLAPASSTAFTGHHCSKRTCRYFTSSYRTAKYFYDRRTCDQWKNLDNRCLEGFRTKRALKRHFDRKLHPPC